MAWTEDLRTRLRHNGRQMMKLSEVILMRLELVVKIHTYNITIHVKLPKIIFDSAYSTTI